MNDNIIKTIDNLINIIIIGILLQLSVLMVNSYSKTHIKLYSATYSFDNVKKVSFAPLKKNILNEDMKFLKSKINSYTEKALKNSEDDDILIIKVKKPQVNVVEKVKEELKKVINKEKQKPKTVAKKRNYPNLWHRVKRGESLTSIAKLYGISVNDIKKVNHLTSDIILEGQKLKISKVNGIKYKVKPNDNLWIISKKFDTTIKNIMQDNILSSYTLKPGQELTIYPGQKWFLAMKRKNSKFFDWPLNNKITSPFGWRIHPIYGRRMFHSGVDIRGSVGEPIKAAASGTVTYAGNRGGYGKVVIIKHARGYETRYGHCSKILVKVGDKVKKDQIIAKVGNTGISTGPHLHFEIRKFGKPLNPMKFK
jgi:murein DD-endopeptidase MepM/ murein hydrolase activator NlpD